MAHAMLSLRAVAVLACLGCVVAALSPTGEAVGSSHGSATGGAATAGPLDPDSIRDIMASMPDYQTFPHYDEVMAWQDGLAADCPAADAELIPIGTSTEGLPISALVLGSGPETALFVGLPHPNEPMGLLCMMFLADNMCSGRDDLLARLHGYTFVFVFVAEPDGFILNEPWTTVPYTTYNYTKYYYRPTSAAQMPRHFPFRYKDFYYNDTDIPGETKAIIKVIDRFRPTFLYSAHNAFVGDAFFLFTRDMPSVYTPLRNFASDFGIPLSTSDQRETPWQVIYADSFFSLPHMAAQIDYRGSSAGIDVGGSMCDYVTYLTPSAFCFSVELTWFTNDEIYDDTPTSHSLTEVNRNTIAAREVAKHKCNATYWKIKPLIEGPCRFCATIEAVINQGAPRQVNNSAPATVADVYFRNGTQMLRMGFTIGQVARLALQVNDTDAAAQMESLLLNLTAYARGVEDETFPLQRLIKLQTATTLLLVSDLMPSDDVAAALPSWAVVVACVVAGAALVAAVVGLALWWRRRGGRFRAGRKGFGRLADGGGADGVVHGGYAHRSTGGELEDHQGTYGSIK